MLTHQTVASIICASEAFHESMGVPWARCSVLAVGMVRMGSALNLSWCLSAVTTMLTLTSVTHSWTRGSVPDTIRRMKLRDQEIATDSLAGTASPELQWLRRQFQPDLSWNSPDQLQPRSSRLLTDQAWPDLSSWNKNSRLNQNNHSDSRPSNQSESSLQPGSSLNNQSEQRIQRLPFFQPD